MSSSIHQDDIEIRPKCIGSTGHEFCGPVPKRKSAAEEQWRSNLFRDAQFSGDGTTIVTQHEDHCLRTFVLPIDLLDHSVTPKMLSSYATWDSGNNIQSFALYPGFNLQDSATTLALCGAADVPITLRNVLDYDILHATYPFVSSTTEKHFPPRSLAFTRDGSHFLAGSENTLATFDCSRNSQGPITFLRMRPGRHAFGNGLGKLRRKGVVSALNISNTGILAVGTLEREIALFEQDGLGAFVTSFELERSLGTGITDLRWSPDGMYLLIAERQSDLVQVYDMRDTHMKVASLTNRRAMASQPLHMEVVPTSDGYEVWGGGTDGNVRMWSNPGTLHGDQAPNAVLKLHDAPVASAVWHPTGAVLATASGRRYDPNFGSDDDSDGYEGDCVKTAIPDNTMKIWTV